MVIICPNCPKSNLIHCKVLHQTDPNFGKEYHACSNCQSKWYNDDPNLPKPEPESKKKKSVWERLGTWGSPTLPDGMNHTATYIFPPVHDYPQMVFPVTGSLKPNFANSNRMSTQTGNDPTNPPVAQTAPSVHDLDIQPAPPPPAPSIHESKREPTPIPQPPEPTPEVAPEPEKPKSIEQQIEEEEENALYEKLLKVAANSPLPTLSTKPIDELIEELSHHSREPSVLQSQLQTPILNEGILSPVPSIHDRSPILETGMMTPIEEVIAREEEDELREKLFKIISSPVPATPMIYSSHVTPHLSINSPKSSSQTPVKIQSKEEKEEEEFREKLYKIVATPRNVPLPESREGSPSLKKTETPNSPIVLPTHTPLIESLKEKEEEISLYAEKISKRLDEAILKSPYIKSQYLSPLLSPIKSRSNRSTSTKKSVGSKHTANHQSNPNSKCATPKSISRSDTPKSKSKSICEEEEEEPQIPASFVDTPRSNYLNSPLPNPSSLFDGHHSETNESHSKGKSKRRVSIVTTASHRSNSPLFSC